MFLLVGFLTELWQYMLTLLMHIPTYLLALQVPGPSFNRPKFLPFLMYLSYKPDLLMTVLLIFLLKNPRQISNKE